MAERVVRTLGALVPLSVAGLLRDVVLAGPYGLDLQNVADHAGCGCREAEHEADWLGEALAAVRQPRVLVLQAGFAVGTDFIEELSDQLEERAMQPRRLRVTAARFGERLIPALAPVVGVLAQTMRIATAAPADFRTLVTAAGRAGTFRARARRVV